MMVRAEVLKMMLMIVRVMLDIPSKVPSFNCFIATIHCCVLCDATQGSLSLGISNITRL